MENYLETLINEKAASGSPFNLDAIFMVEGPSGANWMSYQNVVHAIVAASKSEQKAIRSMLVRIDFNNGDVFDFFRHLARAIAI